MKPLHVTISATILSALLSGVGFAEQQTAPSAARTSSPGGGKAESERERAAEEGAKTDKAAEPGVDSSIRTRPLPGKSRGKAPSSKKGSKPALGAYTKKYQHHPAANGVEKEKPAGGENHASVPGDSLKEQESKLHRLANPQENAAEARPLVHHPTPSSPVAAGNSAARGQGLIPAPGRHSPNPAIIGGGNITSRTKGAAVIGGTNVAGLR